MASVPFGHGLGCQCSVCNPTITWKTCKYCNHAEHVGRCNYKHTPMSGMISFACICETPVFATTPPAPQPAPPKPPDPIPMILHCPACGERHVDVGEFATKSHHTHACQECGFVWRPAIVATVGVQFLPGFKNEG